MYYPDQDISYKRIHEMNDRATPEMYVCPVLLSNHWRAIIYFVANIMWYAYFKNLKFV